MTILSMSFVLLLQAQLSTVSGTVTKPGGNEPLAGAKVTLTPVKNPASLEEEAAQRSALSEDDGRFTIRDVEPGDYRLVAQNPRYGTALYGQRKSNGPAVVLSIAGGRPLTDLRVSMIPTGSIAGRITGPNGEPAVYANVQALKYVYENGTKSLSPVQHTTTDDRGDYRLFWLPAGQYVVAAAARMGPSYQENNRPIRPGDSTTLEGALYLNIGMNIVASSILEGNTVKRVLDDGTIQEESWLPMYYPTTIDPTQATRVDVTAGAAVTGINLSMRPARVQNIRGRVVGSIPGNQTVVTLLPQSPGMARAYIGRGASTVDGSFVFPGVVPGSYYLVARDRTGFQGAPVTVQVGERDVDNITISVSPGVRLRGRLTIDGAAPPPPPPAAPGQGFTQVPPGLELPQSLGRWTVSLVPDLPGVTDRTTGSAPAAPDGSLIFNGISPGDYQVLIGAGVRPRDSKPVYIKSIRYGQTDVTNGIHIDANASDTIEVKMTTDSGSVEGTAIGARNAPAVNATIVLVPNARKRFELYKTVVTGIDGRFRFQDIATGDYKLFAWEDVENGAWQDPDFLRLHESKGQAVRVTNQNKENVQVTVITAP